MNSEETENKRGENAGSEEDGISEAIGSLPRAAAPEGFESRVFEALSETAPAENLWSRNPRLVIAGAAALCIAAIAGLWFAFGTSSGSELAAAHTAGPESNIQPRKRRGIAPQPDANLSANGNIAPSVPGGPGATRPGEQPGSNANDYRGGSEDMALSPAQGPLRPKGLQPMPGGPMGANGPNGPNGATSNISVESIFEFMGLKTECSPNGCKVLSVMSGSIGARSGVQVGDVIIKTDQTELRGNYQFKGQATVKHLTLIRHGKQVGIDIGFR